MSERDPDRDLALAGQFMELNWDQRIDIVIALGLAQDGDTAIVDNLELFARWFARAEVNKLLPLLWEAIEKTHGRAGARADNPYRS